MRAHILNMHSHSMQEVIMGFPPTLENLIMNAPQVKWLTLLCWCQIAIASASASAMLLTMLSIMVYRVRANLHSMHTFTRL